ncbi:lysoplasmalogenase [Pseudoalteromonas sp. ACER1]|uniref:lysoplasmalogenase n=1 Tax=unclassified Pseudoalteromonas TaxID=194690 RepID=UPI001F1F7DC2|nr:MULTISPECIES: lysoplasmalogenase [unclassified Pseudoalteromonas]MCF2848918.1 lysoplasmalogenase [Pseudoalteromonas sp. PAST1]MCO7212355.1 lysoplasmalogenase [Pseudoalteromonas sp. ACER1]
MNILFLIFSSVYIASLLLQPLFPQPFLALFKTLPIGLLIVMVLKARSQLQSRTFITLLFALSFSALGDVLLALDTGQLFIGGLAAFFVSHAFYIITMLPIKNWRLDVVLLYLFLAIIVFCLFYPNLNDMLVPVIFYMLVLTIMASFTWMTDKSNGFLVLGGAVFVISDSILGLNRFYLEIAHADIAIMTTYYIAQLLLITGFLNYYSNK